jgi:hypothetical protein
MEEIGSEGCERRDQYSSADVCRDRCGRLRKLFDTVTKKKTVVGMFGRETRQHLARIYSNA